MSSVRRCDCTGRSRSAAVGRRASRPRRPGVSADVRSGVQKGVGRSADRARCMRPRVPDSRRGHRRGRRDRRAGRRRGPGRVTRPSDRREGCGTSPRVFHHHGLGPSAAAMAHSGGAGEVRERTNPAADVSATERAASTLGHSGLRCEGSDLGRSATRRPQWANVDALGWVDPAGRGVGRPAQLVRKAG